MTGRYVAFEGIEGAGKSTIVARVVERLDDGTCTVVAVREPGGTATGERIRSVLLDGGDTPAPWAEALLFAAGRAQLATEVIAPALAAGSWVVSDRSVYSSLAYQGAARGLGIDEVRAVNEAGLGGVWPDLVVLLRIDPAGGLARQEIPDRIGAEPESFQGAAAMAFDALAAADPDRFVVIDASRGTDEVVDDAYEAVRGRW